MIFFRQFLAVHLHKQPLTQSLNTFVLRITYLVLNELSASHLLEIIQVIILENFIYLAPQLDLVFIQLLFFVLARFLYTYYFLLFDNRLLNPLIRVVILL